MAISRARKEELVAQYIALIDGSVAIFLTDYTGMDVKTMNSLRDKVYEIDGSFHVTKNTLLSHALAESDRPVPLALLDGQVATGFARGEIPTMAKALVDFAKEHESLKLRGAIMGAKLLSPEDVEALAKLPSLDQLRSQLIGLLSAPAQNVVSVVTNSVRQIVNVIDAYAHKEDEAADEAGAPAEAAA